MTTQKTGRPTGKTGQAKVLDDKELKRVLSVVESGNHAKRNIAIVILSNYLGLGVGGAVERITELASIIMRFLSLFIKTAHLRLIKADNAIPGHIANLDSQKGSSQIALRFALLASGFIVSQIEYTQFNRKYAYFSR